MGLRLQQAVGIVFVVTKAKPGPLRTACGIETFSEKVETNLTKRLHGKARLFKWAIRFADQARIQLLPQK